MSVFLRAFYLSDTHGVPLAVQVQVARSRGVCLSLPAFYRDALRAGWAPDRARSRVEEALVDVGESREYVDRALRWLDSLRVIDDVPGEGR